jgi:predicted RNase H-like HicB family nuclease
LTGCRESQGSASDARDSRLRDEGNGGVQKMKTSDKYLKIVEWSEEDGCYVGTCPGVMYGGVHGDDETRVCKELCQVVKDALELYEADNRPMPRT